MGRRRRGRVGRHFLGWRGGWCWLLVRNRVREMDALARSGGHRRRRRDVLLRCWRLDPGGGQLWHLLCPDVVEDLDGEEMNARAFRQTATPINFYNIVIMGP